MCGLTSACREAGILNFCAQPLRTSELGDNELLEAPGWNSAALERLAATTRSRTSRDGVSASITPFSMNCFQERLLVGSLLSTAPPHSVCDLTEGERSHCLVLRRVPVKAGQVAAGPIYGIVRTSLENINTKL